MLREINGYMIDVNDIKYIEPADGKTFKFMVGTKEFQWKSEFREELVNITPSWDSIASALTSNTLLSGRAETDV